MEVQQARLDRSVQKELEMRPRVEVKWLGEGRPYQDMFLPVLSHLATEATSYYACALAVTIIVIMGRLELKNQSLHLADELPNDLLKKKERRSGTGPTNVPALPLRSPSPAFFLLHIHRQAFSVSLLKSGKTGEMTRTHHFILCTSAFARKDFSQ